jgi:hypothetical protein
MEMLTLIPEVLPLSFSSGELGLVIQAITAFLSVSLACIFDSYIKLNYSFCGHMTSTKVLQVLSIGLTFFFVNCILIMKKFKSDLTLLVYGAFSYAIAMVYFVLLHVLGREPFGWLLESTTRTETRVSELLNSCCNQEIVTSIFLADIFTEDVGNFISGVTCFRLCLDEIGQGSFCDKSKKILPHCDHLRLCSWTEMGSRDAFFLLWMPSHDLHRS